MSRDKERNEMRTKERALWDPRKRGRGWEPSEEYARKAKVGQDFMEK